MKYRNDSSHPPRIEWQLFGLQKLTLRGRLAWMTKHTATPAARSDLGLHVDPFGTVPIGVAVFTARVDGDHSEPEGGVRRGGGRGGKHLPVGIWQHLRDQNIPRQIEWEGHVLIAMLGDRADEIYYFIQSPTSALLAAPPPFVTSVPFVQREGHMLYGSGIFRVPVDGFQHLHHPLPCEWEVPLCGIVSEIKACQGNAELVIQALMVSLRHRVHETLCSITIMSLVGTPYPWILQYSYPRIKHYLASPR